MALDIKVSYSLVWSAGTPLREVECLKYYLTEEAAKDCGGRLRTTLRHMDHWLRIVKVEDGKEEFVAAFPPHSQGKEDQSAKAKDALGLEPND